MRACARCTCVRRKASLYTGGVLSVLSPKMSGVICFQIASIRREKCKHTKLETLNMQVS